MGKKNKNKNRTNFIPKKPFVSVCTPTYNRRPFIPSMIRCFEHQTYPKDRIEWIIVDDGTDKIEDLVTHIPQVKYLRYEEKQTLGPSGSPVELLHDPPEKVWHEIFPCRLLDKKREYGILISGQRKLSGGQTILKRSTFIPFEQSGTLALEHFQGLRQIIARLEWLKNDAVIVTFICLPEYGVGSFFNQFAE